MRKPRTISKKRDEDVFRSSHELMRKNGDTGVVESDDVNAGAVFLDGVVVYARYRDKTGDEALDALSSDDSTDVWVRRSKPEAVRMFRTYVNYLGDEAVLDAEPIDGDHLDIQRVEGVLVDGVRNLASASWRGESDTSDRTFFPEGDRTALVADTVALERHVSSNDLSGYAAGDGKVVTFRDGEVVDGASVDLNDPVRSEVGAGGGWVVVDSDTEEDEDENDDGFLNRIF